MLSMVCSAMLVAVGLANALAPVLLVEAGRRPGRFDAVPVAKDKDGKKDVVGAIWKVDARNDAGQTRNFRFRAKDGKLYNPAGKVVGAIKPLRAGETLMTWNDPLPLQGQFKITMSKVSLWAGSLKDGEGVEWRCRLECIDR